MSLLPEATAWLTALPAPGVLDPDPPTARRWLERELARPEYRESLVQRLQRWFGGLLDLVLGTGAGLALVATRLRRTSEAPRESAAVFDERRLRSEEHRRAARAAQEAGRHDEALLEAVRALTAGLSERGLLPDRAGVTVAETTRAATGRFPELGADLARVARDFDATRYGQRTPGPEVAAAALALEEQVRRATPGRGTAPAEPAVPR